jgi:hypothetical protein
MRASVRDTLINLDIEGREPLLHAARMGASGEPESTRNRNDRTFRIVEIVLECVNQIVLSLSPASKSQ